MKEERQAKSFVKKRTGVGDEDGEFHMGLEKETQDRAQRKHFTDSLWSTTGLIKAWVKSSTVAVCLTVRQVYWQSEHCTEAFQQGS